MENASKALLIAGAILIVILLIALGMLVYRGAQGSINKAIGSMSSTEKQIHNSKFEDYLGDHIPGSNVRSLLSNVLANNDGDATGNNIQVSISGTWTDPGDAINHVNTSYSVSYSVVATYTDGVITDIQIVQN